MRSEGVLPNRKKPRTPRGGPILPTVQSSHEQVQGETTGPHECQGGWYRTRVRGNLSRSASRGAGQTCE
jgi:hypothetical protein